MKHPIILFSIVKFVRLNDAQIYRSDRSDKIWLNESIMYPFVVKHSCGVYRKTPYFLSPSTYRISKYEFESSYVKS